MKKKFSIALSLAMILAIALTSLALAADPPAHVVFTTDLPCAVSVLVISYTDPNGVLVSFVSGSTPWTLDTLPSTPVSFTYPIPVVCNGVTYNTVSISPSNPVPSGPVGTTTTVIGHYLPPVSDTTPPVWTLPADFSVEATGPAGAVVTYNASATDPSGVSSQSCFPVSGDTFPLGTTTVNCTATDTHGNTSTGGFNVTVVPAVDTTPPVITVPADIMAEATSPAGAMVSFSASANDAVDGAITPTCVPASGLTFPLGTTLVACTATDAHSNSASASFHVTVVDTTPPALTLPSNMAVTAWNASGASVNFNASANDLVDGPVAVTCSPASGLMFPIGQTTVNCSASDSRGNHGNGSFTVAAQYAAVGLKCNSVSGHQVLQPINTDGSSVFKQGSMVPVKFRVCGADGKSIGTAGVVTSFRLMNSDQTVLSATSDTGFRSGNQQWIFNLSTKNLVAGNTYVYLIMLNDGSTIQFQFSLK